MGKANWIDDVRPLSSLFHSLIFILSLLHVCVVCLGRLESWRSPFVIYYLVIQLLVAFVASVEIWGDNFGSILSQGSCWEHFLSVTERIGL